MFSEQLWKPVAPAEAGPKKGSLGILVTRSSSSHLCSCRGECSVHPQGRESSTPGCSGQVWPCPGEGHWQRGRVPRREAARRGGGAAEGCEWQTQGTHLRGQRNRACGSEEYQGWGRGPEVGHFERCPARVVQGALGGGGKDGGRAQCQAGWRDYHLERLEKAIRRSPSELEERAGQGLGASRCSVTGECLSPLGHGGTVVGGELTREDNSRNKKSRKNIL